MAGAAAAEAVGDERSSRALEQPNIAPMELWESVVMPSEQEAWAEHRAALDATLFAPDAPIVLELRDGSFVIHG